MEHQPGQNDPEQYPGTVSDLQLSRLHSTLAAILLVASVFILNFAFKGVSATDPDQYFHLAVSKAAAETGLVRQIPQAEDLGWGKRYPEKIFLFHLLTTSVYRVSGETGVRLLVPVLVASLVVAIFLFSAKAVPLATGLTITVLFTFLHPHFYYRMLFLRSHLLAVVLFTLLVMAILARKPIAVFVASLLFALAYHVVVLPLAAAGLCVAAGRRKLGYVAIAGLIIGTCASPYFPQNLEFLFTTFGIAFDNETNFLLGAGREVFPLPVLEYLRLYGFQWALVIAGSILLFRRRAGIASDDDLKQLIFLTLLSGILLAILARAPRATEYATPVCALLAFWIAKIARLTPKRLAAGAGVFLVLQISALSAFYGTMMSAPAGASQPDAAFSALKHLPDDASGKKIFHCEWESGAYILYARPDMRFVDMLDPRLLFEADSGLAILRAKLNWGKDPAPYATVSEKFRAQYVLCANRSVVRQLEADPKFKLISPAHLPYLFSVVGP